MIVKTKLYIPSARKALVSRPRLINKLNDGMKAKLTLVSAQAGYGKTTALSVWAKQCSAPVAWVSLDKQDNDLYLFLGVILASIQLRLPDFGQATAALLEQAFEASTDTILAAFLNELAQESEEIIILLDDYHVIDLPVIHQSLGYLLEHLPSTVHFYIASRTDLAIPTARLLANGEIHMIEAQDLRFKLDESIVFFRDMMNLQLYKDQVQELFRQTEGWVSGLQLAAITLKQSGSIAESIRQFNGRHRHISDFFLQEVYLHQPEPLRDFLLATSILSRMNRDLCQAVTGQEDSQEQLERLEQLNMFIIPLDEQRNWYRYHHLLSEFLQRLLSEQDPERWRQTHVRAAEWLEKHGFDEEAAEHYIQGQQAAHAVRVIERILLSVFHSKSYGLMKWIAALPESSYENSPMITIFYISQLIAAGEWEKALQRAWRAEIRFEALRPYLTESEWNQVMGNLYYFCGVASYLQLDLPRASHYFELLDRCLPEGSSFQHIGIRQYQVYERFTDLLSLNLDLSIVEQFLLKWIQTWENRPNYPFVGYFYVLYCRLLYEWNRLEEAERILAQAMEREDLKSFVWVWTHLSLVSSSVQQALGNASRASDILMQLKSNIDSHDIDLILRRIEAEQAVLFLCQGECDQALKWLEKSGLPHNDELSLSRTAQHLIVARVLAANGRTEEALEMLDRLYSLADQNGCNRDRIRALIVQSATLWQAGNRETALNKLDVALQWAEPAQYIRSFVDEGPVMAEMLSELSNRRQGPEVCAISSDYIMLLLTAFPAWRTNSQLLNVTLTGQEMKVFSLLADGLMNKEIALQLEITVETVKFHLKNIYRKLGASNRVQALQLARALRLLD